MRLRRWGEVLPLLIGADERCVKWICVLCCAPFTLWAIISSANSAALPQPTLIIDSLTTALTSEQSTHRAGLLRVD